MSPCESSEQFWLWEERDYRACVLLTRRHSSSPIFSRGQSVPAEYSRHMVGAGGDRTRKWRRAARRKIIPTPDRREGTALLLRAARPGGNLATRWGACTQALTAGSDQA